MHYYLYINSLEALTQYYKQFNIKPIKDVLLRLLILLYTRSNPPFMLIYHKYITFIVTNEELEGSSIITRIIW